MKRKVLWIFSIVLLMLSLAALAAAADSDIDQHRDCRHCGMDRKAFGYSRMLVEYRNGTHVGTCSLHCVITELNSSKGAEVVSFKVADRNTQILIDAEKAYWTIGGEKRGVMTQRAKWAFATKEAAQAFIAANDGRLASWREALAAAREDAKPGVR
jgi:nitrous oxide reductase accessory protein NosL